LPLLLVDECGSGEGVLVGLIPLLHEGVVALLNVPDKLGVVLLGYAAAFGLLTDREQLGFIPCVQCLKAALLDRFSPVLDAAQLLGLTSAGGHLQGFNREGFLCLD